MSISGRALFLLSSSALCFTALGSGVALADGSTSGDGIETVLVTAEKRVEDVQKMSSAVTALSGDDLLQRQITSVSDLQRVVPGLVEGDTLGGVQKAETIRGIGTANAMPGGDPGVAVSVDGHYMQDSGFVVRDLLDVSRVEVLRGPQGTLYGRNATGGAINVITNRPTQDFDGYVTAGVGSFGDRNVTGLLNGGLTDDLAGRVAVSWDKNDGYLRNISPIAPQKRLLNTDSINARASLEYDPSQNFHATLSAYGYQNTGNIYAYRLLGDLVAIGGVNFSHLPAGYSVFDATGHLGREFPLQHFQPGISGAVQRRQLQCNLRRLCILGRLGLHPAIPLAVGHLRHRLRLCIRSGADVEEPVLCRVRQYRL